MADSVSVLGSSFDAIRMSIFGKTTQSTHRSKVSALFVFTGVVLTALNLPTPKVSLGKTGLHHPYFLSLTRCFCLT